MERQPQNPEFRINPENFHPCIQHTLMPPLNTQADIFSGARVLNNGPCLHLHPCFVYASSKGSILCKWAGLLEPLLLNNAMNTKILCAYVYMPELIFS